MTLMTENYGARALGALMIVASIIIIFCFWGLSFSMWTFLGLLIIISLISAVFMYARGDYVGAATPSLITTVLIFFLYDSPSLWIYLCMILLIFSGIFGYIMHGVE